MLNVTVAAPYAFEVGQMVEIGSWPRWMYRTHLPSSLRRACQWITKKVFRKNFGPQVYTVISCDSSSTIRIS